MAVIRCSRTRFAGTTWKSKGLLYICKWRFRRRKKGRARGRALCRVDNMPPGLTEDIFQSIAAKVMRGALRDWVGGKRRAITTRFYTSGIEYGDISSTRGLQRMVDGSPDDDEIAPGTSPNGQGLRSTHFSH